MQITSSSHSYSSAKANAAPTTERSSTRSDFSSLANYDSRQNTIFQNLLKNPDVADNVVLNNDGSYSFNSEGGVTTSEENIMRLLINEQNGDFHTEGQITPYSVSELALFRQMTGYNLIQAAGIGTVVDDNGSPVPAADRAMAEAAWNMFDTAKGIKDYTNSGADITIDDLKAVGEMRRDALGADKNFYQDLLDLVDRLAEDQTS